MYRFLHRPKIDGFKINNSFSIVNFFELLIINSPKDSKSENSETEIHSSSILILENKNSTDTAEINHTENKYDEKDNHVVVPAFNLSRPTITTSSS